MTFTVVMGLLVSAVLIGVVLACSEGISPIISVIVLLGVDIYYITDLQTETTIGLVALVTCNAACCVLMLGALFMDEEPLK